MGLTDIELYATVTVCSFVLFLLGFNISWIVSAQLFKRVWSKFPPFEKADWCSRFNSTLHAIIVVPGFIITLALAEWDENYFLLSSGVPQRVFMCISLGYFAFDFIVIIYYRVPLWVVFVVHHIVASVPYYLHLFHPCDRATFAMSMFLLVEFATFFLNFQVWLEKTGHAKETRYTVMFYMTYLSWFGSRVVMPIAVVAIMWKHIFFGAKADDFRGCLIPTMVCGHLILLFCLSVFFFVMTPDLMKRWKETPEDVEKKMKELKLKRRRSFSSLSRRSSAPNSARTHQSEPIHDDGDGENGQQTNSADFGATVESRADYNNKDGNEDGGDEEMTTVNRTGSPSPSAQSGAGGPASAQRSSTQSPNNEQGQRHVKIGEVEIVEDDDDENDDDDDVRSNLSIDDVINVVLADNPISGGRPEITGDRDFMDEVLDNGITLQESNSLYGTTALH